MNHTLKHELFYLGISSKCLVVFDGKKQFVKLAARAVPAEIAKQFTYEQFLDVLDKYITLQCKIHGFSWYQNAMVLECVQKSAIRGIYLKRLCNKDGTTKPLKL